jgi:hypothetical protein
VRTRILGEAPSREVDLVLVDESGFHHVPGVVKTYAPRSRTPALEEWQTRDQLSVIGGNTPGGKVHMRVRTRSLNGLGAIEFLVHPGRRRGDRRGAVAVVRP